MKKRAKKLQLHKESIRTLTPESLDPRVAGGDTVYTLCHPCEDTDYSCGCGGTGGSTLGCTEFD
ncbi:MAG: hypothetical protein AAF657_07095 [Acidobacteriota bacterium]